MTWLEFVLAFVTASIGSAGGLGGAVLLVPLLVLTGMPARDAAPLGLVSVAAGSLAASERHVRDRLVNHRIGVTTEVASSAAAVVGALASGVAGDRALKLTLAGVALLAGLFGGRRKGIRNLPDPTLGEEAVGEHTGALSGAYRLGGGVVPYRAARVAPGAALFAVSGLIAGLSGTSGGFIKTPATSEVMRVPVRVAAATTTFTIGITAAAGLIVFALQGRVEVQSASAVCAGGILGGAVGARVQSRLSPPQVRRFLSVVLVVVAVVLVVRA